MATGLSAYAPVEQTTIVPTYDSESITVNSRDSLRSLITQYPELRPVFERFGLDVENLGWLSLRTMVAGAGLELETVRAASREAIAAADAEYAARHASNHEPIVLELPARRKLPVESGVVSK
jgi:hypothetical protein